MRVKVWPSRGERIIWRIARIVRFILFYLNLYSNDWQDRGSKEALGYLKNKDLVSSQFWYGFVKSYNVLSVLEIGSNCGPRVINLAQKYPDISFIGLDLNKPAIDLGNSFARVKQIRNLKFVCHNLLSNNYSEILGISDQSVDLVLSWATLIYIKPKDIINVIQNILNIQPRLVLLLEVEPRRKIRNAHLGRVAPLEPFYVRNYFQTMYRATKALGIEVKQISEEIVPLEIWNPGGGVPMVRLFELTYTSSLRS